jgi:23S rRNA (guanosine2251-2'-O)-methyltransferase
VDILYGRNPVLEALRSGRPARKVVIAEGVRHDARLDEIVELAQRSGTPIESATRNRLDDIAHTEHHQGVAGYFHARAPGRLDMMLQHARTPALLLALDGIQDPQNLGAIARSAEATAVDGMVLARHRSAAVTPAAAKASAGATEHVPVAVVPNLVNALEEMAAAGLWRVGLDAGAKQRYDRFDYTQPVALVVGAEGQGLRQLTQRHCDALVSIPMLGRVGSLNAGAAAAVLLYEVQRQRGFAPR